MVTIIMAGGRGTRIRSVAADIPKPMIPICGKPVLEHEIECLRDQGFREIVLTVSHMRDVIMDYFGDGSGVSPATGKAFGIHISYFVEETPLGNAGALFKLRDRLTEDFLLLNADSMFDVDFNRFVDYHRRHGGLATIFTHPNSHPGDSGLIIADPAGTVTEWLTKEDVRPEFYRNRVNAGLHVLSPGALDACGVDPAMVGTMVDGRTFKVDLDRQILRPLCGSGRLFCYDSPEYVKDMGTPDRFASACRDMESGLVQARNLLRPQRAIFLDRDGTINREVGFLRAPEQMELLPGAAQAIRQINQSGFLAILVTNQPVIARGEVTEQGLRGIHNRMETLLAREGAYLDAIYYCPHHPHRGYDGEIPELKIECGCRKPKPGMLLQAAKDFHIDLEHSWMIGDDARDVLAGKNAGCRTVLIGERDEGQDFNAGSLAEAAARILEMWGTRE